MSIIVLTPKPKTTAALAVASTDTSMAPDLLHMLGVDAQRFDTFEQLRDYAQAQIDAAAPTVPPAADAPSA